MTKITNKSWNPIDENDSKSVVGKEMPFVNPKQSYYDQYYTSSSLEGINPNPLMQSKSIVGKEMPVIDPKQSNYDKFYTKSTIETANNETSIVAATQDVPLVKFDSDAIVDQLIIDTDAELQKGESANHDKIYQQVRKIVTLLMHRAGIIDQHYANEQSYEVIIHVKKLKDTYNSWLGLTITVVSAGLTVAGGVMGVGGVIGGASEAFLKLATSVGSIGGGTNMLSSIFNSRNEGSRVIVQFDLEEVKRHRDQKFEGARKNDQSRQQALQNAEQGEYVRHKMFSEQTGSTGG